MKEDNREQGEVVNITITHYILHYVFLWNCPKALKIHYVYYLKNWCTVYWVYIISCMEFVLKIDVSDSRNIPH